MPSHLEEEMRAPAAEVDALRGDDLTEWERTWLDVIAFGWQRQRDRRAERATLAVEMRRMAAVLASVREPGLIASMGVSGAPIQRWAGVIGAEGRLTGDGRLIEFGALTWASFPLPLRYVAEDHGGHDGAVLVGKIDAVHRGDDGLIYARGVFDLGSDLGREVVRLIEAGMLSGVSLDLDNTTAAVADLGGRPAQVISEGRVRAATLVSIPAFDVARIAIVGDQDALLDLNVQPGLYTEPAPDDCGCDDLATAGLYTFIPTERPYA